MVTFLQNELRRKQITLYNFDLNTMKRECYIAEITAET